MSDKQFANTLLPQVMQITESIKVLHHVAVQPVQQQTGPAEQEQQQILGIIP
jgi:hypothetical protein